MTSKAAAWGGLPALGTRALRASRSGKGAATKGAKPKPASRSRGTPPRRQRRNRLVATAALVLVGLVAAFAGGLAWPAAQPDPTVGENVVVSGGLEMQLVDARNSPTIARNPTDPDNVVVTQRVDRPSFSAELHYSRDGGRTWATTELPLPDNLDRAFAPDAAFGPDGRLYVAYVNLVGVGNVPDNLWLAHSDDGGQTLSEPTHVAGSLVFQTRMVVDPEGTLHLTYVQATDVALLQFVGPVEVVTVRSTDRGTTFTDPVRVSDLDRERVGAPVPAIDADGDLVVVYKDFTTNVRDFQNLEGPVWEDPAALVFTRSDDGGETFAPGVVVDDGLVPAKRFLVFLPEFPALAAGQDGTLVTAWSDGRNGDEDVFLRRSTDGGETWGDAPVRVNDNERGDGTAQYLPAADIAPNGRIDVAFFDRRDDPDENRLMHTTLAYSSDGGETFRNVTVSSEPTDSSIGDPISPHIEPDFGTRIDVTSDEGSALVAWTDTRLGEHPDHGRQDIFAAEVTLPEGRPTAVPSSAAFALAVVALAGAGWTYLRAGR